MQFFETCKNTNPEVSKRNFRKSGRIILIYFNLILYNLAQRKFSYLQEHEIQKLKQEEGNFICFFFA